MSKIIKKVWVFIIVLTLLFSPASLVIVNAENTTAQNTTQSQTEETAQQTENTEQQSNDTTTDDTTGELNDYSNCLYGDVNLDGKVDISDAVLLNKIAAQAVVANEQQLINGDVYKDSDNAINQNDALELLKFLVSINKVLPVYEDDIAEALTEEEDEYTYEITGASYNCSDFDKFNTTGITVKKIDSTGEENSLSGEIRIGESDETPASLYESTDTFDGTEEENNEDYKKVAEKVVKVYEGNKEIGSTTAYVAKRGDVDFNGKVDSSDIALVNIITASAGAGIKAKDMEIIKNYDENLRNLALVVADYVGASSTTSTNEDEIKIDTNDFLEIQKITAQKGAGYKIENNGYFEYSYNDKNEATIVKYIGDSNVETITIPEKISNMTVVSITELGTANCKKIILPKTISGISNTTFVNMKNLESIEVDANNQSYAVKDGILYNKNMTELVFCPRNINKTDITIDDNVSKIATNALFENNNIKAIEIGSGVNEIGERALAATNSTNVHVSESNATYKSEFRSVIKKDSDTLVYVSTGATGAYTVPSSVKAIGNGAFYNCNLESVTFSSNSITEIQAKAFERLNSKKIVFNNNVTIGKIKKDAFANSNIEEIDLNAVVSDAEPESFSNWNTKVLQLGGKAKLSDKAFSNCANLTTVTVLQNGDDSVCQIGKEAFDGCVNLTEVTINGNTTIGEKAFAELANLEKVTINGNTEIGDYAFSNCSGIQQLSLGNSIKKIGNSAFMNCENITSVTIPQGIQEISKHAFENCTKLNKVDLSNTKKIGTNAFYNCTSLSDLSLKNVSSIGQNAFHECNKITDNVLATASENISIGKEAFYGCSGLQKPVLGKKVTLQNNVFQLCDGITEITIKSVNTINQGMFAGDPNLKNIKIRKESTIESGAISNDCNVTYIDENGNEIVEPEPDINDNGTSQGGTSQGGSSSGKTWTTKGSLKKGQRYTVRSTHNNNPINAIKRAYGGNVKLVSSKVRYKEYVPYYLTAKTSVYGDRRSTLRTVGSTYTFNLQRGALQGIVTYVGKYSSSNHTRLIGFKYKAGTRTRLTEFRSSPPSTYGGTTYKAVEYLWVFDLS